MRQRYGESYILLALYINLKHKFNLMIVFLKNNELGFGAFFKSINLPYQNKSIKLLKWQFNGLSHSHNMGVGKIKWWAGRDLNSYTSRCWLLRPVCLPIPPPARTDFFRRTIIIYYTSLI